MFVSILLVFTLQCFCEKENLKETQRVKGTSIRPAYNSKLLRQATKRSIICPDGLGECPDGDTCCKLSLGDSYGCCTVPNAVCCSDGKHCCPQGYVCEVGTGECTR